jgi:hypothetical protein
VQFRHSVTALKSRWDSHRLELVIKVEIPMAVTVKMCCHVVWKTGQLCHQYVGTLKAFGVLNSILLFINIYYSLVSLVTSDLYTVHPLFNMSNI